MAEPWEVSRWEWRVGDVGDPAHLLQDFLVSHGIPADDLTAVSVYNPLENHDGRSPTAALLISAAAAAEMAGYPERRAVPASDPLTPSPDIPDVVAIVYDRKPDTFDWESTKGSSVKTGFTVGEWDRSWTKDAHVSAIETVRGAIAAGEVYQANVVGHQSAPYSGDPVMALAGIQRLSGASYGHLMLGKGWGLATASPECLVTVADGHVISRPIKGTRPRTSLGRVELLRSPKERAEHVMIVDLVRNDLAQIATTGSVQVPDLFTPRPWCELWQAESTVSAELRKGVGLSELLRAISPAGSVTGAPKMAAIELIHQIEPVGRGPSMGAIGWITPTRLDLGVTIRTMAAADGLLHLWTGGGITWSSDPLAEVAEAEAKAEPLKSAIRRNC